MGRRRGVGRRRIKKYGGNGSESFMLNFCTHTHTHTHTHIAPAVIPTSLKATLLSTTPSAQTFNFTWELNMEAGSDDHLGFILRCHDTQDSSPNSMASVSGVTFAQSTTLTVSVATGCNGLMCQIAPFNELGEGVASSAVSLPPSCLSGETCI